MDLHIDQGGLPALDYRPAEPSPIRCFDESRKFREHLVHRGVVLAGEHRLDVVDVPRHGVGQTPLPKQVRLVSPVQLVGVASHSTIQDPQDPDRQPCPTAAHHCPGHTTPRGTYVADDPHWTLSARDRLARVQRVKSLLAEGETSRVTTAELIIPPLYVAEIFNLEPGDQVVRREWLAGRGKTRTVFAVTWYPASFAALVPDLLNTAPGRNHGLSARVLEAIRRTITHARDDMRARPADAREASALGLPVGSPILAGVHRWSDAEGIIEYGEWCLPPRFTIGYEYQP